MTTTSNPHMLIVEDDLASLELLASYFEVAQYDVTKAENAHQTLAALENSKIDIILLDINLPDGDGLSLTKEIRKTSSVGIILVTHKADDVDVILGLELGADDYVTKPFNARELFARVKNLYRKINSTNTEQ